MNIKDAKEKPLLSDLINIKSKGTRNGNLLDIVFEEFCSEYRGQDTYHAPFRTGSLKSGKGGVMFIDCHSKGEVTAIGCHRNRLTDNFVFFGGQCSNRNERSWAPVAVHLTVESCQFEDNDADEGSSFHLSNSHIYCLKCHFSYRHINKLENYFTLLLCDLHIDRGE